MRHRLLSTIVPPIVFGVVLLGSVPFADAQVTSLPNNKCLEGKIKNVGKSLAARADCFSKEASSGVVDPNCPQKARDRFAAVFSKLDMKYATTTPPCLTFSDQGAFETALTDYAASIPVTTGMALGKCDAAKIKCVGKYVAAVTTCARKAAGTISMISTSCTGKAAGNLTNGATGCLDKAASNADCTNVGSQAGVLQGEADQFIQDALLALASDHRYIDNGDGTVTDSATWLMWEKKTTAVGSGQNFADPHDVDNDYSWTASGSPYPPDGTAFTDFLFKLNTEPCFAGHCDWRLPSEEGRNSPYPFIGAKELESILLAPFPCGKVPCIDPIFAPTVAFPYWSATTYAMSPDRAWSVDFFGGRVDQDLKSSHYVRAVRAAPIPTPTATATPTPTAMVTETPTPTPVCTPSSSGTYTDNCDGTVTDSATGLQWEKKTTAEGSGENLTDPHDVDNTYTWNVSGSPYPPDGTAFTDFLFQLNTEPCFAGHCDWRLPSEEGQNSPFTGAKELESILLAPYPCGTSPCIDPIFGPTVALNYWSATTDDADSASYAWLVGFDAGFVGRSDKGFNNYVRAVRVAPAAPTPTPTPTAAETPTPTATVGETLTPTPVCTPSASGTYTDNCDGTVTDSATGLMWEKKTTAVGSGQNLADPHDADNQYTWSVTSPYTALDGTAFTQFLATLNAPPCFAGHCDWRLPSEEGRNVALEVTELESILLAPYPCGTRPCIDPIFGPTVANYYWSATTKVSNPNSAWTVNFSNGNVSSASKNHFRYVRAVRTGS